MQHRSAKPKPPLDYEALLEMAVRSLASRMKSERDLRRKLAERAVPPAERGDVSDVDRVIARLRELGYLSDERFAADFTRLRKENEKLGRRRVQQGLMAKGVPQAIATEALAGAYDDTDEVQLARAYIARKRMKPPTGDREQKQKETAKAMRRLVAAGFSSGAVWKVLRAWDAELEEVDVSGE